MQTLLNKNWPNWKIASWVNEVYKETPAEIAAGATPTDYRYETKDMRRYGIVPDSVGARAANTAAINALLNPNVTGPVGSFVFPNVTGSSTYYFNDIVQIRSGCHLDLDQCTLNFEKTYAVSDDRQGFLTFIRDVSIVNGAIEVNYDGSAGTNAGVTMLVGSRRSYAFGAFTGGIDDEDLAIPMGNIALKNLRITTNNPGPLMCVLMLGGLENVDIENVVVNGQDIVEHAFYYEFGFYHYEATVANRTTSHAYNLNFKNITGKDMRDDGTAGSVVSLIGAGSSKLTNISGDVAYHVVEVRPGEALFYNVGAPYVFGGGPRPIVLENISGQNLTNVGMSLVGAESSASGYLSGEGLTEAQQTELYSFSVDGFSFDETIASVSGPFSLRNGVGSGAGVSGGLIIGEECVQFDIDNVRILDGAGVGIRANISNGIWATPRLKIGSVRNSQIAGNAGAGISLNDTESVEITNNRLGYNALYDAAAESTQDQGVVVGTNSFGVKCDGNYVTTSGGAVAYAVSGTGPRGCEVRNMRGTATTSGKWIMDGILAETSTNIASAAHAINTVDKFLYKKVWDSSNDRLMISLGSDDTSPWERADGLATVTPV